MADRWTLILSGGGAHHSGHATDIDALAAEFLAKVRASGHAAFASMTANGQSFEITPAPPAAKPAKSDPEPKA